MSDRKPVSDTELHAYLDGQLDPQQRQEIENDLQHDPASRDRLAAYQHMNQQLHQQYDGVLDEPIPAHLVSAARPQKKVRAVAAALLFFLVGTLTGWQAQLNLGGNNAISSTDNDLVQPAVFAHAVYTTDTAHPVEVSATQHQQLDQWLSKRLKTTLSAPNLTASGYRLVGGRLLPSTEDRMAAQYMYENTSGQRITLYVRRGNWKPGLHAINYSEQKGYSMFYWIDKDLGYAITTGKEDAASKTVVEEVYRQLKGQSVQI